MAASIYAGTKSLYCFIYMITTIYILWYMLFNEDKFVAILANKEITAIEILNMLGTLIQSVDQQQIKNATAQINISSLSRGTYICRVTTPEGIHSKLFVKE